MGVNILSLYIYTSVWLYTITFYISAQLILAVKVGIEKCNHINVAA